MNSLYRFSATQQELVALGAHFGTAYTTALGCYGGSKMDAKA